MTTTMSRTPRLRTASAKSGTDSFSPDASTRSRVRGVSSPDIEVTVRQATLMTHDISLADIARVLSREAVREALLKADDGEAAWRVLAEGEAAAQA